ncbi:hypothetical protein Efla_006688 [Eimeria flavescens]
MPIVMVCKASGAWRPCCDYREIKKYVNIPEQPLPRTDDRLAFFQGKRYFSVLDMCSAFYQIEIEEQDRSKTSFVTPDCQRQYKRITFGFASSPASFQHHQSQLRQLFEALRGASLQLHPAKCCFGAASVEYLGHIVSRDGIRACPSKIQAIVDMVVPANVKAVQRFLGKCQYHRKFIPNFSSVAAPLSQATTVKDAFKWKHSPLEYIQSRKSQCRRVEGWALRLQEFLFTIIRRPGSQHKHGDCLSLASVPRLPDQKRLPSGRIQKLALCVLVFLHIRAPPSKAAHSDTSDDQELDFFLSDKDEPAGPAPARAEPEIATSSLDPTLPTAVASISLQIVLPPPVQHDDIRAAQQSDPLCQKLFPLATTHNALAQPPDRHSVRARGDGPVHGPLPITHVLNTLIVVFIDHRTRWVELVALSSPSATAVPEPFFNHWVSRWGGPRALLSENGPQFTAELFKQLS